jgi:hypothetical protein
MRRIGVLKDVAYGAKIGGGTVAGLNEAGLLQPGAMAIFNPFKGTLLTIDGLNTVAALADAKDVVVAFGRASGEAPLLVTTPRRINNLNVVNGRAFVKPVITLGGITAPTSFLFENTGDVSVKVIETTFTSNFGIPSIHADEYKTAGMTAEALVDKIVAKLNAGTSFGGVTATKIKDGGSSFFGITITPNDTDVQIEVAIDGMWSGALNVQTTNPVYGIGAGAQILEMEKGFSVEEGNGNYIDYTNEFFKGSFLADLASIYNQITLSFDAYHMGATTKRHVASNDLIIAQENDATLTSVAIVALLALVYPTYASVTTGQEIANDDGTDNDGVSGN